MPSFGRRAPRIPAKRPIPIALSGLMPSKPRLGMIVRDGGGRQPPPSSRLNQRLFRTVILIEGDDTRHDADDKSHRSFCLVRDRPGSPRAFPFEAQVRFSQEVYPASTGSHKKSYTPLFDEGYCQPSPPWTTIVTILTIRVTAGSPG